MAVFLCGCGWLNTYLADRLLAQSVEVFGTTTSTEKLETLTNKGINVALFKLGEEAAKIIDQAANRTVVLSIPAGRSATDHVHYKQDMSKLIDTLNACAKQLIFISTTSVYGEVESTDHAHYITETSPTQPSTSSGDANLFIENYIRANCTIDFTIVRLSGLVGPDRHPVRYLAGRTLGEANKAVNLVYVSDVVNALVKLIAQPKLTKLVHLSSLAAPARSDYYTAAALHFGLTPPHFLLSEGEQKNQSDPAHSRIHAHSQTLNPQDFDPDNKVTGKIIDATMSWKQLGIEPEFDTPYKMLPEITL